MHGCSFVAKMYFIFNEMKLHSMKNAGYFRKCNYIQ